MKESGQERVLARRYARALLQVALEKKTDPRELSRQLTALAAQIDRVAGLAQALASPTVRRAGKTRLVEKLLEQAQTDRLIGNLLRTMAQRDRLGAVAAVAEAYARALDAHEGIEPAEVTSAEPLSERQQERLSQKLAALTGKRVRLSYRTESAILGGLVVKIGNRIYDGSIVKQLESLKGRLLGAS